MLWLHFLAFFLLKMEMKCFTQWRVSRRRSKTSGGLFRRTVLRRGRPIKLPPAVQIPVDDSYLRDPGPGLCRRGEEIASPCNFGSSRAEQTRYKLNGSSRKSVPARLSDRIVPGGDVLISSRGVNKFKPPCPPRSSTMLTCSPSRHSPSQQRALHGFLAADYYGHMRLVLLCSSQSDSTRDKCNIRGGHLGVPVSLSDSKLRGE
ncbi:hypothetical protein CALCODRAFT_144532 [Calocera cornea HHB12733]|uniref:Uncharacterized protein n=1 Tax=Calocera cornea HHB12733 TaxID=1353952 RepID=A0A165CSA3_9BASI|nr:hypothetical protein CALCODRAFT_144532 [Calocera cornea HHB12733]